MKVYVVTCIEPSWEEEEDSSFTTLAAFASRESANKYADISLASCSCFQNGRWGNRGVHNVSETDFYEK